MRTEMIVFSGRRNPTWRLRPKDARALEGALHKLNRVSGPLEVPERLGYCGMVVSNDDQPQSWTKLTVYHECVLIHFKGRMDYLIDDGHVVEKLLLETAADHVDAAVIESIRAESGPTGDSSSTDPPLVAIETATLPERGEPSDHRTPPSSGQFAEGTVMPAPTPVGHIYIDSDIKSYQGYMPDEWGEKTIGVVPEGTVLERLLLDLGMSWRSASYTAQMPATAIRAMHAAAVGRSNFVSPDSSIVAYSEKIIGQLCRRVPKLVENGSLRADLIAELATIAAEFRDRAAAVEHDYPVQPIWAQFMTDTAFQVSLWSSQRVAYVAFYNAYETFIVDCVKRAIGMTSLRTQNEEFKKGLRTGFAKDIADPCWFHPEINIARLVRHALSHNGGRETEDLKKQRHGVKLIGEELQIVPEDNHRMLRQLRKAVEEVIGVTSADPKYLASASKLPQPREDED